MKKRIEVNKEHVIIDDGQHSVILNKRPILGWILVFFSFKVNTFVLERIDDTGIARVALKYHNYIYLERKDFYSHVKMTDILTDIIEFQSNGSN